MGTRASFSGGMPFHTNQFGLGKRHWNLETFSAVVEFPPLYQRVASVPPQPEWAMFKDMWWDFILDKCLTLAEHGRNRRFQKVNGVDDEAVVYHWKFGTKFLLTKIFQSATDAIHPRGQGINSEMPSIDKLIRRMILAWPENCSCLPSTEYNGYWWMPIHD